MGGRGKRGKPTSNTRGGLGRGAPPPAQFNPAPTPAQSAWSRPAPAPAPTQSAWGAPAPAPIPTQSAWGPPAPAPVPTQSAWGAPAPAPIPAQSAWGRQAPVAATPTQSAWGKPAQASVSDSANGHSSSQASTESVATPTPDQPTRQQRQQQPRQQETQQQPRQQGTHRPEPRTYVGYNGTTKKADRGSIRDRKVIYSDIVVTKNADVSKKGTSGQKVLLTTNHFRLVKKPDWQLYQYRVDFSPPIEHRRFMDKLIREQKNNLGGYLFDGTILFLCKKLPDDVTEFMTKDRDGNPIQTTVKFVKLISMLNGESIQILNLILRRSMAALDLQLVGRNFFDAIAKVDMHRHGIQLWPGYETSIRQHERDILLCAQITNKVMRTETVMDIFRKNRNHENFKQMCSAAVLGTTVLTGYNNKTYRVDDITFDESPMSTFDTKSGTISFMDYYKQKYNITIRDPHQPMLIHRSKERDIRGGVPEMILLIPELCRATGFTDQMRENRFLMEDVAKYTRLNPRERIAKLLKFNERLQTTIESVKNFEDWNTKLDRQMLQLEGRQLAAETIYFGQERQLPLQDDWSNAFRNMRMYNQVDCLNWTLIVPKSMLKQTQDFIGILKSAAGGMQYKIADPTWVELPNDFGASYVKAMEASLHKNLQLVMCIMAGLSAEKYTSIKKRCYIDRGVPSQVMLGKTITPKPGKGLGSLMTVGTKVAIQINAKLGGAPWMVNVPDRGIMVVGFDVCHDTNDKSKSFGALVATMDMKVKPKYFSAVSAHKNGEELCNAFALNMSKAVQQYALEHKYLPKRIFIYRDGVGEGQTDYVREHEIEAIRSQLNNLYKNAEYKLLFVVVSKRINARFFRNGENPGPGTIVDDVVTLPERHDFLLIAQKVRQGTVSPTNYNILFNTSGLSSDSIQKFTYSMTHLYYNWTSTLAVPAVCQYAHKLAFLVGNFLHQAPSEMMNQKLYFL